MKRFVAFCGGANSGIQTKEKALEWASSILGQQGKINCVHLAEVCEVIERAQPQITAKQFFVALEDKAA